MKGIFITAVVLFIAWQLDVHFNYGKYTDAILSILRQMRHSFG
jgi:hypothetical protein